MPERTVPSRHANRSRAAPYPGSRPGKRGSTPPPPPQSKSALSIFTGLFNFITRPWGGQRAVSNSDQDGLQNVNSHPSMKVLHDRAEDIENEAAQADSQQEAQQPQLQMPQQQASPPPPPPPPRRQVEPVAEGSSGNTYSAVAAFLNEKEKNGQQLNAFEIAGVMSWLNQSIPEEKREPFRFSSSPSAPLIGPSASSSSSINGGGEQATRTPRMLSKNPNGPYRWNGASSARPRRTQNRYSSPGFGTTRTKSRIVLTPTPSPEKPETKGKRRRMDGQTGKERETTITTTKPSERGTEDVHGRAEPQASTSSVPFPTDGNPSSPQSTARTNGASASPTTPTRLRTSGLQTKPAVPSPLRQAWRAEPESPPAGNTVAPSGSGRPTRVAHAMTELLKGSSPKSEAQKRREAFANPYEAMSPVPIKPAPKKPLPPRKRKVAEIEKSEEKGANKMQEKDKGKKLGSEQISDKKDIPLSPQKIIEATVPKGAKRSRPPPDLEKERERRIQATADEVPPLRRSSRLKSPEPNPAPAASGFPGFTFSATSRKISPPQPTITVEEAPDEDESPKKRVRTSPTTNGTRTRTVTIEEVDDIDMPLYAQPKAASAPPVIKPSQVIEIDDEEPSHSLKDPSPSPTSSTGVPSFGGPFGGSVNINGSAGSAKLTSFAGGLKSSAPKVSSKLRYSFQADKDEKPEEEAIEDKGKGKEKAQPLDTSGLDLLSSFAVPGAPKLSPATLPTSTRDVSTPASPPFGVSVFSAPPTFLPSTAAPASSSCISPPAAPILSPFGPPPVVPTSSPLVPPSFAPSASLTSAPKPAPKTTEDVKNAVKVMAVSELPVYRFDTLLSSPGAGPSTLKARESVKAMPVPSLPAYDFTLSNPASTGLQGTAASAKSSATTSGNTWRCSLCMLVNQASTEKCTICGEARPVATPASAPAESNHVSSIVKPVALAGNSWTCTQCMLNNPASAKEKCTICEAPRQDAAKSDVKPGFDWVAAGMKKPDNAGGWTCSVCMVPNSGSAKKCVSCTADR